MAVWSTAQSTGDRGGGGILAVAFGLSSVVNLLRLSGPIFMILVYDRVLTSRSTETLVALFVMLAVLLFALAVMDYARRRALARYGAQFQERMEARLLGAAGSRDLFAQGRSKPVAGLDEVDGLRGFLHSGALTGVFDFVWSPLFLLVIFVLDPLLGWVCAGGAVLIALLGLLRMGSGRSRRAAVETAQKRVGTLRQMAQVSRDTIRTQDMARGFKDRWTVARMESRDRAIAAKDLSVWFDMMADFVLLVARYGVLAVGAWLTLQGQLTIGAMVAATFLVSRVLVPVERFFGDLPDIIEARQNWLALRARIGRIDVEAPAQGEEPGNLRARLSLVNVAVRSPVTGALILKSVTLDIAPGEIVQVTGMTGRGKTVLGETILGLWRRSAGTILVDGHNLDRIDPNEIARLVGYVPDSPGFVAGTLAENIARLDPEATPDKVAAAARKACLHAIISALPDGYQTQIEPSGAQLARGARAQLALARAVYHMPALLIFDEPDALWTELVPDTLDKTLEQLVRRGGSVLVLSRKRQALRQSSTCYQIEDGRLKLIKTGANTGQPAGAKVAVLPAKIAATSTATGKSQAQG
jgi:ABC-type protease/lipase transport system fused ATPase/permease subunit